MAACRQCRKDLPEGELLEGLCTDCIYRLAQDQTKAAGRLSRDRIAQAKLEVEAEAAGLFAPGILEIILDELVENVTSGEDEGLAKTKAKNDIQRLGAMGVCREMIKMGEALTDFAQKVEEEARRKLGALLKSRKEGG